MKRSSPSRLSHLSHVTIEAEITELAPGGDGVAHVDAKGGRRAIFVPGAVPGDRVLAKVDMSRKPARGRLHEVLAAGPMRAPSPCEFAARCGGCDWMHVSVSGQERVHLEHVLAALPPAYRDLPVRVHSAAEPLESRTRTRLHVRASGGRAIVGLHQAGTHDPVEVTRCILLHPALERARQELGPLLEGAHGRGEALLSLGGALADGDAQNRKAILELHFSGPLPAPCFARFEQAVTHGETWAGFRVSCGETSRPAVIGNTTPWTMGFDNRPLQLAVNGFAQASESTNRLLVSRVAELAKSASPPSPRIVELYCGAGNLSIALAEMAGDLVCVEENREACVAARANFERRGQKARVIERDAATFAFSPATHLLVLDPPRTGAREVAERLTQVKVRRILYVSCDPQTLRRDLATLVSGGYAIQCVELFEMFPFTSHVETLVLLERSQKPLEGHPA